MEKNNEAVVDVSSDRRLSINRGIAEGKAGIDRNYEDEKYKGVIRGFAVMTKGNVKDFRAWEIDDTTLDQIVKAGNVHKKIGLKSRFGHPSMSGESLGTFFGRAMNFYKDGDVARADLYISKTAYETPDGSLADYVLSLAEKDPDAFGTSVVLGDWELEHKIEKSGAPKKNEEGKELPPCLRVSSLMSVDVVDDPAANNGMFGKFFNQSVELSAKASEFLNKLLDNPRAVDRVLNFLERYRSNRVEIDELKQAAEDLAAKQSTKEEGMEGLKDVTLDQLRASRPDLVAALQAEGKAEGLTSGRTEERARALAIVKAGHAEFKGMGMEPLVEESLEKGFTIDASLASMRGKRLADLSAKSNKAPGSDSEEEGPKSHLEKAKDYQKEHKCTLTEALKATASPRKQK